ncbi:hypothetical protein N7532_004951 [Penicillium argentinense]|uniref:Nucleoporin NUP49/NSP49 n=1 Tax=Penicillium argentinense TaxID=1131581 RepID=A0A9W9K9I4_9EURO|nr:uncharacterized protein N7532_004951 [Penicillium argentinense]KAJ5097950.1 hypothetical protein N7532_004951 [Penicillium argentinense]
MSLFAPKSSAPSTDGLSINTNSANSLFSGGNNTQTNSKSALGGGTTGGGLFGNPNSTTQPKPAGGLFGGLGSGNTAQPQSTGTSMFSGLGNQQQNNATGGGGGLFGQSATASTQPAAGAGAGTGTGQGGLFGGAPSTSTTQTGTTAGGLFGGASNNTQTGATGGGGLFGGGLGSATQTQAKPSLGLGTSTTGGGLFGTTGTQQPQQQQTQKPTLSLFGNPGTTQTTQQPLQQSVAGGSVAPGVALNLDELLPTTKFESCAEQVRKGIENIDNYILDQIKLCNEVSDMLPTIESQGSTIPYDVEFVQGKLETIQHALENDAGDIDQLRGLVARDAAEAQVGFRAIDTLKLPLQYQSTSGNGWWSMQDQKVPDRRSTRKNTLALPDDVEADPATATAVNGVPVNLVDYFSQRSDEMSGVLDRYKGNLKEIEDHLHGVELTLNRQISEFVSSRSRDGAGPGGPRSAINDLAAVLGDVEAGILGVANRLSGVSEQVQEVTLGPLSAGEGRLGLN